MFILINSDNLIPEERNKVMIALFLFGNLVFDKLNIF